MRVRARFRDYLEAPLPCMGGDNLRRNVLQTLKGQGYPGGPWLFKHSLITFHMRDWLEAWPDSRIVITKRDRAAAVKSNREWVPESLQEDWEALYSAMEAIHQALPDAIVVDVDKVVAGEESLATLAEQLGLTWTPEAEAFLDPELWNRWPK
jgi:hypothetical protein